MKTLHRNSSNSSLRPRMNEKRQTHHRRDEDDEENETYIYVHDQRYRPSSSSSDTLNTITSSLSLSDFSESRGGGGGSTKYPNNLYDLDRGGRGPPIHMYHRYQGESHDEDQDDDDDEKDDDTNPDATTEDDHDDLESLDNCGSLSYSVESAFSAISHEPNTTRGDTLMRRLVVVDESRKRRLLTSSQDEDDNDTEDSTPTTSHRTTPAPDRREDTKTNEDEKIECCFYPFSTTLLMYVERMFPNLKRTDSSSSIFVGIDHNNSNNTHTEELRNILEELRNIPSTNRAGT